MASDDAEDACGPNTPMLPAEDLFAVSAAESASMQNSESLEHLPCRSAAGMAIVNCENCDTEAGSCDNKRNSVPRISQPCDGSAQNDLLFSANLLKPKNSGDSTSEEFIPSSEDELSPVPDEHDKSLQHHHHHHHNYHHHHHHYYHHPKGGSGGSAKPISNRPVLTYLPSPGGFKNLGLTNVASESIMSGSSANGVEGLGQLNHQLLPPGFGGKLVAHKPGVLHQVASEVVMARSLGLDTNHQPLALHQVASETAMALATGHCNLHKNCSLQGASWQNLCIQQKEGEKGGLDLLTLGPGLPPPPISATDLENGSKASLASIRSVYPEGRGLTSIPTNTTLNVTFTGSTLSVSPFPFCRICHMAGGDFEEPLISPCRCSGTMKYIHGSCLMKWMDICSRRSRKTQRCELCQYQYTRKKRFQFKEWKSPRCSRRDRLLHFVFLINLIIMIGCAIATVYCFLSDKGLPPRSRYDHKLSAGPDMNNYGGIMAGGGGTVAGGASDAGDPPGLLEVPPLRNDNSLDVATRGKHPRGQVDLTSEEVVTLCCGVLFFVSFFVAMYAQIKAKHTLYQLFIRFTVLNTKWEIEEYDRSKDPPFAKLDEKKGVFL